MGRGAAAAQPLTAVPLRSMLFSASTDKTVAVWDSETGERVKRLKGHTSFVNSCYPARRGPQLVCTGSDDGTVKVSARRWSAMEARHSLGRSIWGLLNIWGVLI